MDALSTAVSGMHAAQLRMDVAANDVANMTTPGFTPSQVEQAAQSSGGVDTKVILGQAPPTLPGLAPEQQPSGTDLIAEMAQLVTAPIAYAANARVVDFSSQATRSLLNVFA